MKRQKPNLSLMSSGDPGGPELQYSSSFSTPYTCLVVPHRDRNLWDRHLRCSSTSHHAINSHHRSTSSPSSQSSLSTTFAMSPPQSSVISTTTTFTDWSNVATSRSSRYDYHQSRSKLWIGSSLLTLLLLNVILLMSAQSLAQPAATARNTLQLPSASQYAAPGGCEWRARSASPHLFGHMVNSGGGGEDSTNSQSSAQSSEMLLTCHFRTLNGPLDAGANLSLIPADRTAGLALLCEDVLFESTLPPRSFDRLHTLRELHIDHCKLAELHPEVFVGLGELRQLTIRTHNTDWGDLNLRLSPEVFLPLRALEQLDLSENGLTSLPSPLFCPLSRLQFLNVSANVIGDVASLGFSAKQSFDLSAATSSSSNFDCRQLNSITHLDASHNRIKVLTNRGFSRLPRLQILNLRHNLIARAEDSTLNETRELIRLDLPNNQLVALPNHFFVPVQKTLTELYLQNNSISVIPPFLFSGVSKVITLDLSHNEITAHWIGKAIFSDMTRLISLDLSHNKIDRIDGATFRALYALQSLSLQHNQIESIAKNAFADTRNLHTLSLSHNKLTALDAASFSGLEVLNSLALDQNRLLSINAASFANITNLMELNLASNRLGQVPTALGNLHMLRSLDLSNNEIRDISNASYQGLDQLYGLNLQHNKIGNLSRGDFLDLPSLRVLNLANNQIASVEPGTFDDIVELHALRLDSNQLRDINQLFVSLRDLLMLNISANRIVNFDYAMVPLGLQWLDLHANQIEVLHNFYSIEAEVKLRTLDASSNQIADIDELSLPNSIELVLLNRNVIRKIAPHTFQKKPNLTRVDLSDNRLQSLDLNAIRLNRVPDRRPLPEFSIGGNPFLCDCNMEWLQRAALISGGSAANNKNPTMAPSVDESRLYPRVVDAHLVQCRLPFGRLSGAAPGTPSSSPAQVLAPLVSLQSSQFLCSYRSHCFALCHCCEFDACDCEMTCPDNCTCFYDQSWNSNIVDCGVNQHTVVPGRIPMDVTDLYLDGNNIPELSPHTFIGRKNMRRLHLNSSHIRAINNRTFNGLKSLEVLNLASNELDTLYGYEFERLTELRELYLQNNRISTIGNRTFAALRSLAVLRLDHNRIVDFELWTGLAHNFHIAHLYVGANDWSCECHFVSQMMEWLPVRSAVIRDLSLVHCQYNNTYALPLGPVVMTEQNQADIEAARANISAACNHYVPSQNKKETLAAQSTNSITGAAMMSQFNIPVIVLVCASTFGILLLLGIIVTAVLYRHELSVWIYAKTNIRIGGKGAGGGSGKKGSRGRRRKRGDYGADDNDEKLFDAFVSYSKKDDAFVTQMLAPELEYGTTPMRLCLHYRDLPVASGFMSDAIVEAMAASRRTILVISENFLRGEWCHFEFKSAHQEALRSRARHKLILVFVGPVVGKDLDPDIRMWLKTAGNTCLQWGEKMFWEKLRYALPEIPASGTSSGTSSSSSSTTSSSYGRKGHLTKGGTLPALTSLSQSPLAQSRHALDSYGAGAHLQHIPPPSSAHHPLLSSVGSMHHHTTLGRTHNQYHQQPVPPQALYSPASVHSQQSTYAYPTYMPPSATSMLAPPQQTPPPLPPAHPLHFQMHGGGGNMLGPPGNHHPTFHHHQHQHSGSQHSTTATSLESNMSHHLPHHLQMMSHHRSSTGGNSSAESSLIASGATSMTNAGGSNASDSSGGGGGGGLPFVPSASSTTAVAVHI